MTRQIPPFFIVGAPRCGTTAMSRYLGKHPNICFSKPKETHYFASAPRDASPDKLREEFVSAFFPDISEETMMLGEGAVSTLYSKDAIQLILQTFDSPKFIVMLRDPVELVRSYHARVRHLRLEDQEDLPTAWALQEDRAKGRNLPRKCHDPRILQYGEIGRIGFYSAQLLDLVGPENCMAIFFEDLLADTLSTYKTVLRFLDIPYDGRVDFKKTNAARTYRSGLLQSIYTGPLMRPVANQLLNNPVRAAKFQRALKPLRKKLKKINAVEESPAPLDPQFARQLRMTYADDIKQLEQTFDRDLGHWITGTTT
jgi:hypothetical protein